MHQETFYSTADFLAHVEREGSFLGSNDYLASRQEGNESFRGTSTFGEQLELARQGWTGAPAIEAISASLDIQSTQTATVYDTSGEFVDVGAFVSGVPECMVSFQPTQSHKTAKIVYDLGFSYEVPKEQIEFRGAVIMALCQSLKQNHVACEIWAGSSIGTNENPSSLLVKIQDSDRQLSTDALAFWLCHPGVLRRLNLSWVENLPATQRQGIRSGYGPIQALPRLNDENVIMIENLFPKSLDEAKEVYEKLLETLNH